MGWWWKEVLAPRDMASYIGFTTSSTAIRDRLLTFINDSIQSKESISTGMSSLRQYHTGPADAETFKLINRSVLFFDNPPFFVNCWMKSKPTDYVK